MMQSEIRVGHTYFRGLHHRMVVGIYPPAPGIKSDSLVEYRVRGNLRVHTTGLDKFSKWALAEDWTDQKPFMRDFVREQAK